MPIDKKLEQRLFDITFGQANDYSDWMHHDSIEKINYNSGPRLEVDPKDAKTLEEVKSFKIIIDINGIQESTFERCE